MLGHRFAVLAGLGELARVQLRSPAKPALWSGTLIGADTVLGKKRVRRDCIGREFLVEQWSIRSNDLVSQGIVFPLCS